MSAYRHVSKALLVRHIGEKLHSYFGIVLNKFTGLCNLAIPCHLYYAILKAILSSFLVFLIKSSVSILMYKTQFVRLHNVLKQNTGADCSHHNLLISSLSKSLCSLCLFGKLFPPDSQPQYFLRPWVVLFYAVWFSIT